MIPALFRGAWFMLEGLTLLFQPGIKRFVIIPLAINSIVFAIAIAFAGHWFDDSLELLTHYLPTWLHWIQWFLWPLFSLVMLIVVFFTFSILANFIAAPFHSQLALQVEKLLNGQVPDEEMSFWAIVSTIPITIWEELRKVVYALLWAIPLLILTVLLPPVGAVVGLLFTAWMLTLQYSDYPMGNHHLKFAEMRRRLRQHLWLSLGFGITISGCLIIPLVNFIVMPAAVAGATVLWVREINHHAASSITD
jgi:CysZ protein